MNKTPRVLLVEDNLYFRNYVSHLLQKAGYEVTIAANGLEALAFIKAGQQPDLLLLDLLMPELSGLDVIERMKDISQPIPTVLMSAMDLPDTVKTVLLASPTPFLAKPFKPSDLLAIIEQAFKATSV